jgi:hypothetical protein
MRMVDAHAAQQHLMTKREALRALRALPHVVVYTRAPSSPSGVHLVAAGTRC